MSKTPQLFIWEIPFKTEESILPLLNELSASDRETAQNLSRERRQIEFVCGRYLLRKVFRERFQVELPADLTTPENRKPQVKEVYPFNISHSKQYVGFAISKTEEVGLDFEVENSSRDVLNLAKNYGTPKEISILEHIAPDSRHDAFFKLWSMKESFGKATGDGLSMDLQNLDIDFEHRAILSAPKNQIGTIFYSKIRNMHCSISILAADAETPEICQVERDGEHFRYRKLENVHFEKFVFVVPGVAANH